MEAIAVFQVKNDIGLDQSGSNKDGKNGNRFKTGRGTDIFREELGMLLNLLIFSFILQVFIR